MATKLTLKIDEEVVKKAIANSRGEGKALARLLNNIWGRSAIARTKTFLKRSV